MRSSSSAARAARARPRSPGPSPIWPANKIICDLDVDAPDLHLLLQPARERQEEFYSGHEARIDGEKCTGCGLCATLCQFGAIRENGAGFAVDPLRCEGCKVCVAFCPAAAIGFPEKHCGQWYVSATRFGPLVHAQLFPGAENSGRLVMVLKQQARELAKARRRRPGPVRRRPGHRLPGDQLAVGSAPGRGGHGAHALGAARPGAGGGSVPALSDCLGGHHQQV